MYTLVVVDMQAKFDTANAPNVRANVAREIKEAMKHDAGIVFLEYFSMGPSLPELVDLTIGYQKTYTIIKHSNSGSAECEKIVSHYGLSNKHFKVVGVNTSYCVMETVKGLNILYKESIIDVVQDACNCMNDDHYAISDMAALGRVIIQSDKINLWTA